MLPRDLIKCKFVIEHQVSGFKLEDTQFRKSKAIFCNIGVNLGNRGRWGMKGKAFPVNAGAPFP